MVRRLLVWILVYKAKRQLFMGLENGVKGGRVWKIRLDGSRIDYGRLITMMKRCRDPQCME